MPSVYVVFAHPGFAHSDRNRGMSSCDLEALFPTLPYQSSTVLISDPTLPPATAEAIPVHHKWFHTWRWRLKKIL